MHHLQSLTYLLSDSLKNQFPMSGFQCHSYCSAKLYMPQACTVGHAPLLFSHFYERICPIQPAGPWGMKDMWGRPRPNSLCEAMSTEPTNLSQSTDPRASITDGCFKVKQHYEDNCLIQTLLLITPGLQESSAHGDLNYSLIIPLSLRRKLRPTGVRVCPSKFWSVPRYSIALPFSISGVETQP